MKKIIGFYFLLSLFVINSWAETPLLEEVSTYKDVFEKARRVYLRDKTIDTSFAHRREIIYSQAQTYFRQALELAKNDKEKIEAILAIGEMQLYDRNETDFHGIRKEFERLLTFSTLTSKQKGEAYLGIGETYVGEANWEEARVYFQKAKAIGLVTPARLATAISYIKERNYPAGRRELILLLEEKPSNTQINFIAKSYLYSIDLLPSISIERPRLFLNRTLWSAIKKRAIEEEKDYFNRLKKQVEVLEMWQIKQGDFGVNLLTAAFIYKVTEDPLILEKIKAMFKVTLDYYLSRKSDGIRAYSRIATSTALDWMWEYLTPQERQSFASDLLRYAYGMYLEDKIQLRIDLQPWYYTQNMFWYTGLALIDKELSEPDYFRALTLLGQGYHCNVNIFKHVLDMSGDDGAWHLKPDYAFAHISTFLWTFAHTWYSAMDREVPAEWVHILNPDYALRNFLGFEGNMIRHFGYARSWGTKTNSPTLYYDLMNHSIHFFYKSHPDYASIAGHLKKRIEKQCEAHIKYDPEIYTGIFPINKFLLTGIDSAPAPTIPKGMPIARHFEDGGLVLMSSGFGEEDTYVLFSAGGGKISSDDYDTTHFSIYKQGDLALDSGSGNLGEHTAKYARQTVAHNGVLIHLPGENNYGGQNRITQFAKVLAFETSPYFSYVATDATGTYNPNKCKQMVRQFIYLNPNHFIVFDRVVSSKAEYKKEWLLHTSNQPEIIGNEFKAEQDEGRIFCRTLYPLDAVIEKIGGEGKEFWVDGKNWAPTAYLTRLNMKGSSATDTLGRWRVEVSPKVAKEEDSFLHFIQVSDKTIENMSESKVSEKQGVFTVLFTYRDFSYEITVNKTGDIGGHIKIKEKNRIVVDRPLADNIMAQKELALQQ
jgi:heparin/heparan-sulfate lyase